MAVMGLNAFGGKYVPMETPGGDGGLAVILF